MLLSEFLKSGITALKTLYPEQEARSILFMLCEDRLGTKNYTHIVEPQYTIANAQLTSLEGDLHRLQKGEPIQYVIGKEEFFGHTFRVDSNVLIPRPETELLVQDALKHAGMMTRLRNAFGKNAKPVRVLDLCTGSGCIAWSVAMGAPGCEVTAVDISDGALTVASSQNFKSELKDTGAMTPSFVKADVLDLHEANRFTEFDIITSNPPYIKNSEKSLMRTNVLDFEPEIALFVDDDDPLVFYRSIAKWSSRLLTSDGKGFSEINEQLGEETAAVFRDEGFKTVEVVKDFFGKDRFVYYSRN